MLDKPKKRPLILFVVSIFNNNQISNSSILFVLLLVVTLSCLGFTQIYAQTAPVINNNESNAGLPADLGQSSPNFRLDSAIDVVGGDSSSATGVSSALAVMHGYHFIDEEDQLIIDKIIAVPEMRVPNLGNNSTYFLLEILPANTIYSPANLLWSNADVFLTDPTRHMTDPHGVWDQTSTPSAAYLVDLPAGNYDIYFTGYSHLRRKLANHALATSSNTLHFTLDEVSIANALTAGTLLPSNPGYPLAAGDAGAILDADGSCNGNISDCVVSGAFSGDEWGDNEINSLDIAAILNKLFMSNTPTIAKEDQNMDTEINSLDLAITLNNLFRTGDI